MNGALSFDRAHCWTPVWTSDPLLCRDTIAFDMKWWEKDLETHFTFSCNSSVWRGLLAALMTTAIDGKINLCRWQHGWPLDYNNPGLHQAKKTVIQMFSAPPQFGVRTTRRPSLPGQALENGHIHSTGLHNAGLLCKGMQ